MDYNIAIKELDDLVFEEYKSTRLFLSPLFEAEEDDSKLSTPLQRLGSFPARAIRYRKAKNVLTKYVKKILNRADKIIDRFETELDKSIPQIEKKGKDLQNQLDRAKKLQDDIEVRSIVNQQRKFKTEVDKNQELRIQNLNQSIENLINTYSTAIHKRIDDPGYVLKVELSDKGKADLKFLWDENIAVARQEIYEKLIRILNNKNIKGLESLISRLEVEIDDAEDNRIKSRRSRAALSYSPSSKKDNKDSDYDNGPDFDSPEKESKKELSEFKKLKKYLNDQLPDGLLEEDEPYTYKSPANKIFKVYLEIEEKEEKIVAVFYKEDDDYEQDSPANEMEITNEEEAKDLIKGVLEGEEVSSDVKKDRMYNDFQETLYNHIDTLFKNRTKLVRDTFSYQFFEKYKDNRRLKNFSKFMVGEIIDNPDEYSKQEKILSNQSISDRQLINLFLKKFKESFEEFEAQNESFQSFSEYKKQNLV